MEEIVDFYLDYIVSRKLNTLPQSIELEMLDITKFHESWSVWIPIKSTVTDSDILEFEKKIEHRLPDSYKKFLQYKHFYELQIGECSFCPHPVNSWLASQIDLIYNSWPAAFLIDRGRIPFAHWSDWGLLCFDTTTDSRNDYPIVIWDHEKAENFEKKYPNFDAMLIELHNTFKN